MSTREAVAAPASAAADRPARPRRLGARVGRSLYGLATFALLVAVWEVGVTTLRVPLYVLPPPSAILGEMFAKRAVLLQHAWITTQEILAGYLLAVVVSVPLAVLIAYSGFFQRTLYPVLVFSQIVPKIALAPLFIIWFGFGFLPKLLITFLLSFFPIVVDSIIGFKSMDPEVMDFARSTGAGQWRLFWKIRLPQALPYIFAGLKVSATIATVGAIVAEFVASDRGLGNLLLQANGDLNTRLSFAVIIVLSTIGLLLYFAVEALERWAIPWHVSQRPREGMDATM